MASKPDPTAADEIASAPRTQISLLRVETVISRSVAIGGVVFALQAVPTLIAQVNDVKPVLGALVVLVNIGGIIAMLIASIARRAVKRVAGTWAIAFLCSLLAWPLITIDPTVVADQQPWLWLLCTVGIAAAALAFRPWQGCLYLVIAPAIYGFVRMTPSGGGAALEPTLLGVGYAFLLGGGVLVLIALLRQAATSVDNAQAAALDRYANAVRQHATEVERVQIDSIVHDSVLTTLLSAARANTPNAQELATRMARDSMGQLKDAAAASPDDHAMVDMDQLANRIMGATTTLSAPFELRVDEIGTGQLPTQAAEAVYAASVQAMVNSIQHAGDDTSVRRWLSIRNTVSGGLAIDIGDTGAGFATESIPMERLGVRVSIMERVSSAGGSVAVESRFGAGTIVRIVWPLVDTPTSSASSFPQEVSL